MTLTLPVPTCVLLLAVNKPAVKFCVSCLGAYRPLNTGMSTCEAACGHRFTYLELILNKWLKDKGIHHTTIDTVHLSLSSTVANVGKQIDPI